MYPQSPSVSWRSSASAGGSPITPQSPTSASERTPRNSGEVSKSPSGHSRASSAETVGSPKLKLAHKRVKSVPMLVGSPSIMRGTSLVDYLEALDLKQLEKEHSFYKVKSKPFPVVLLIRTRCWDWQSVIQYLNLNKKSQDVPPQTVFVVQELRCSKIVKLGWKRPRVVVLTETNVIFLQPPNKKTGLCQVYWLCWICAWQ